MRTLAQRCFVHRRLVLAGWVLVLLALSGIHAAAGSGYKDSFKLAGTDSADALALLQRAAPKASGDVDRIVVATNRGRITDPKVRARIQAMLARVTRLPHVASVVSPYTARDQIAADGRVGYAVVTF